MTTSVVFVHGAFCGGWAFDPIRAQFEAAGFATFAPDLPFHTHGANLDRLAQTGVKDYADAIADVVRAIDGPVVLAGHSLGGLVAQIAAARAPVAALVLMAPSAPWGVPATTIDEHANALGVSMLGDYWRRPISPDYATARRTTLDRLSRDEARKIFARFVPESGRALFETLQWWLDHAMNTAAPPYRIAAPVLALAGARDHVNPSSTVRRIAKRFPSHQADFMEIDHMSHWLMGEPEFPLVAQTAIDWLVARGVKPASAAPVRKRSLKVQPSVAGV